MGIYARMFEGEGATIPMSKQDECCKRMEILCQEGGMMRLDYVRLFGKEFNIIRKTKFEDGCITLSYNYYEDDIWERARFHKDGMYIGSGKIGGRQFHRAIVAAYVLLEQYYDGVAAACVDGEPVTEWFYTGWINYLFNEQYHFKNLDAWKLYETYNDEYRKTYKSSYDRPICYGEKRYGFISGCEIKAVQKNTHIALALYNDKNLDGVEKLAFEGMESVILALKLYAENSDLDTDAQLKILLDAIRTYYIEADCASDSFDGLLGNVISGLNICDAPAFVVKGIAEIYDKDFWTLWDTVKDVAKRKHTDVYGNENYAITPVPTQMLFVQSPDDMIPYWKENGDLEFSSDLYEWFELLKRKYDTHITSDDVIEQPLRYIVDLIVKASEQYYRIFVFSDFFEETVEHISDKRYLALWKIYEELVNDEELKKAGEVIFVPDDPEYESSTISYWDDQNNRRLIRSWECMDVEKKHNKARATLRRYMALVANKPLRKRVFDF